MKYEVKGDKHWYVFATQTRRETTALRHLQNQGFHCFVPMFLKSNKSVYNSTPRPVPLFPGYGFVKFDRELENWLPINSTRGIKYLLTCSDRPIPIPSSVVSSLIDQVDENGLVSFESVFKIGDKIRFNSGAFTGHVGKLEKLDDKGRVQVLLKLLARDILVKTSVNQMAHA